MLLADPPRRRLRLRRVGPKHRDKRSRAWGFIEEGRVSNLNQARYDENAELYQWLEEAVTSLAGRITLKSRVYRG